MQKFAVIGLGLLLLGLSPKSDLSTSSNQFEYAKLKEITFNSFENCYFKNSNSATACLQSTLNQLETIESNLKLSKSLKFETIAELKSFYFSTSNNLESEKSLDLINSVIFKKLTPV